MKIRIRSDYRGSAPWDLAYVTTKIPEVIRDIAVHLLTYESCWFEVTPLPDDYYEIAVKSDRRDALDSAFKFIHRNISNVD